MDRTLQQLYHGEIFPESNYCPKIEEFHQLMRKQMKEHQSFADKLPPLLRSEFDDILDDLFNRVPFESMQMYIDGFRCGARMVIEIYEDEAPKN